MNKIDYIITGDFGELSEIMIPVMKENRLLSDKPNVKAFTWYPISEQMQCVEIELSSRPNEQELSFLCDEFTSITLAVMDEKGGVLKLISAGVVEEL